MDWKPLTVFGTLVLMTAFSVPAQETISPDPLRRELASLGAQSARVVTLLEELVAHRTEEIELRRLQVAVLALQLRSGSIGSIEERIRALQDRAADFRESAAHLESEIERLEEAIFDQGNSEDHRTQLEYSRDQIRRQVDLTNDRIYDLERQILDLENDLAAKRRDIETLEEIVMEGLASF